MKSNNHMDYKGQLLVIYDEVLNDNSYIADIDADSNKNIQILADNCFTQKGVYTVFITLAVYKTLHPAQDIRNHQTQIEDGFSGRTIDTQYITPTLKELGLPSMAESGWLTRSLEQPYPYTLEYDGKISNKKVKQAFLELIDVIQTKETNPKFLLVELLKRVKILQEKNKIHIHPLENPENLTILKIIGILNAQFSFNYKISGGSKLPVIAFYAIYTIILDEVSRYGQCQLKKLGSHTASDRTSKSAGDIEIFKNGSLFEAVEIKLNKQIDANIVRIAKEKIIRYNPERYYIFSHYGIDRSEEESINSIITTVKQEHGCQIVINGILPTLKYYLRLISNLEYFLTTYSKLIQNDSELKVIHKQKWNEFIVELQNDA